MKLLQPTVVGAEDTLFFALRPDAAAAARIHALASQLRDYYQFGGRLRPLDLLHVTLCYVGKCADMPPTVLDRIDAAARAPLGASFEVAFDRVMSFDRRKPVEPLVLCREDDCAPLTQLYKGLAAAIETTGLLRFDTGSFKPHVTMLYDPKMISLQPIAPTIRWIAQEVLLVHSHVGHSRYDVLARYPLG